MKTEDQLRKLADDFEREREEARLGAKTAMDCIALFKPDTMQAIADVVEAARVLTVYFNIANARRVSDTLARLDALTEEKNDAPDPD